MLLEINGEITPERMKRRSQSKNTHSVDVTGDGSRVQCCKEHNHLEIWKARPMNQGKLEVVKKEMARLNLSILGISGLK